MFVSLNFKLIGQNEVIDTTSIDQSEILTNLSQPLFSDSVSSNINSVLAGLQLTVPNGGESWRYGSIPKITWSIGTGITNVKLEYTTNGGSNWTTIISSTPNDGSYLWESMPNISTSNALLKVTDAASSEFDQSDNVFSIISISPNITASPIKILPIGNSITYDKNNGLDAPNPRSLGERRSYRYQLFTQLKNNNYNFDFIGGEEGGKDLFDDFQCAGFPGITAIQLAELLRDGNNDYMAFQETVGEYLDTYTPDVVLIHAGTNGKNTWGVKAMVDKIESVNANAWMIVALIIDQDPHNPDVTTFNDTLRTILNDRINNSSEKIIIVNMENLLDPIDYQSDGLHPAVSGYNKMGDAWYASLQKILGTTVSDYAPVIKSSPNLYGSVGVAYSYDVSATGKPAPSFSLIEAPAGMTIDNTTGVISWTPTFVGSFDVQVQASNTQGSDTQSFTIEVKKYPSDMTHYWKLEEQYGFPYKDRYGSNEGLEFRYPPTQVTGQVGNGLDFNRSETINGDTYGNRVIFRDDNTFDWATNASFSIEMWIKRDQNPDLFEEEVIIGRGLPTSNLRWKVSVTSDKRVKFVLQSNIGTGPTTLTSPNVILTGNWYHIVAVRNNTNTTNKIYINGVESGSSSHTYLSDFVGTYPITLGNLLNSSVSDRTFANRFDGIIDEVALYGKALSTTEILQHYNNGLSGIGYEENQILADITVLLQGPYTSSTPPYMTTALNSGGYLPTSQPYNVAPWSYTGTESVSTNFFTNNPSIVDWVLVELRDKTTPATIVARHAGFLKNDGKIVDIDGVSKLGFDITPDAYYIAVKHRNHLAVMCSDSARAFFSSPSITAYDFSDSQSKAYTSGPDPMATLSGGKFGMLTGDGNASGSVTASDNNSVWLPQFLAGQDGYKSGDYNLNSSVTASDNNSFWLPNNGKDSQVPN